MPLVEPRVALSAASPHFAAGFPLQSLTRNAAFRMTYAVLSCLIMGSTTATAQNGISGNCDYPDRMELNKPYVFITSNDTLVQTVEITALGNKQLRYSIQTRVKDSEIMAGELVERHEGVADWAGCYGPVTDDNIMHIENWDYKTKDGLLIISVYGADPDRVRLEMATISGSEMKRK
ncbi:MAG: hypothetical protein ACO1NQ_07640 [Flavobacteriales bacterium]